MPLTDTAIRKAKPGAGTIKLSDGGGLQKTFIQSFVHPNIPTIRSFIAAPRNAAPRLWMRGQTEAACRRRLSRSLAGHDMIDRDAFARGVVTAGRDDDRRRA